MTAKEMRQFMQIPDNPKEGVLMMSDKFFYEFCEQLCREQRENCQDMYLKYASDEVDASIALSILHAKIPEL